MLKVPRSSPQWHAEVAERSARVPSGDRERFVGYAIIGQQFESGHVLALRRWPASSIGPAYTSVWHRAPDGTWRVYADVPSSLSCARYVDSAATSAWEGRIRLAWSDSNRLCVSARGVGLEWEIEFRHTWRTRTFGLAGAVLPTGGFSSDLAHRGIERMTRSWLGADVLQLSGDMPNGHTYRAVPRRLWLMNDARAWLHGVSVGVAERSGRHADLGPLSVPTSGALAFLTAEFTSPRT